MINFPIGWNEEVVVIHYLYPPAADELSDAFTREAGMPLIWRRRIVARRIGPTAQE